MNINNNNKKSSQNTLKVFFIKLISISIAILILINVVFNLFLAERLEKIDKILLLEKNEFVSYAWRHDIDTARSAQWSVMKRSIFESDYLYEEGDLYPNIHYKDTFGLLSLWTREKDKDFYICRNSLNEPELKKYHVLNLPHGEQGWINDKPFVYHYGRGTTREIDLRNLWIEEVTKYLDRNISE